LTFFWLSKYFQNNKRIKTKSLKFHLPGVPHVSFDLKLFAHPIPGKTGRLPLKKMKGICKKLFWMGDIFFNTSRGSSWNRRISCSETMLHITLAWAIFLWSHGQWLEKMVHGKKQISKEILVPVKDKFIVRKRKRLLVDSKDIINFINNPEVYIFDARSSERYY